MSANSSLDRNFSEITTLPQVIQALQELAALVRNGLPAIGADGTLVPRTETNSPDIGSNPFPFGNIFAKGLSLGDTDVSETLNADLIADLSILRFHDLWPWPYRYFNGVIVYSDRGDWFGFPVAFGDDRSSTIISTITVSYEFGTPDEFFPGGTFTSHDIGDNSITYGSDHGIFRDGTDHTYADGSGNIRSTHDAERFHIPYRRNI